MKMPTLVAAGLFAFATASFAANDGDPASSANSTSRILKKLKSFDDQGSYQVAVMCFGTGERADGMNKICFYDCLGSAAAITIGAVELCPLTINN